MRRLLLSALALLLLHGAAGAADEANPFLLRRGSLAAEGSLWLPLGNIDDDFDPGPAAGLALRAGYLRTVDLWVAFRYQRDRVSGADLWLHHATGDVGLLFELPVGPARDRACLGGGFSFFFVRASEPVGTLLLDDNESDFGHWFRLETPALRTRALAARLFAQQQTAWTKKRATHFALFGLSLETPLW